MQSSERKHAQGHSYTDLGERAAIVAIPGPPRKGAHAWGPLHFLSPRYRCSAQALTWPAAYSKALPVRLLL